jgi:hypothetical protein
MRINVGGGVMWAVIAVLLFLLSSVGVVVAPAAAQESTKPTTLRQGVAKQSSGKQATPKQLQASRPESGPCIGVLSRIGETFTLRKVGITVFGNEENPVPINAWHVDDLVVARVAAFVNKRASVRRVAYPAGMFASLDTPQFLRNDTKAFEEIARPLMASTHCARYIAAIPGSVNYSGTNQVLKGLGIVSRSGLVDTFDLHAITELRVYDENLAFLHRKYASLTPNENRFIASIIGGNVPGPHRHVDKSFWPDPAGVAQDAKLREAMRDLVSRSLDATLPELNFVP